MKRHDSWSRMYAAALFRQGASMNDATPLKALAEALKKEPRLVAYCTSPTISLTDKEAFLKDALGTSVSPLVMGVLRLLLRHHQMSLLSSVATQLRELWDAREGVQSVSVETESELSAPQKSQLNAILTKQFGSQVRAAYGVNPDLLGGLVIKSKGLTLDESVRGRLEALRETILSR